MRWSRKPEPPTVCPECGRHVPVTPEGWLQNHSPYKPCLSLLVCPGTGMDPVVLGSATLDAAMPVFRNAGCTVDELAKRLGRDAP